MYWQTVALSAVITCVVIALALFICSLVEDGGVPIVKWSFVEYDTDNITHDSSYNGSYSDAMGAKAQLLASGEVAAEGLTIPVTWKSSTVGTVQLGTRQDVVVLTGSGANRAITFIQPGMAKMYKIDK